MRFRTRMTAGLSTLGLATGATLTMVAPAAHAVPTFPDGWTPPGQLCQQARTITEDGTPSTIPGLPGMRCGQYLATLSAEEIPETDTELEESVDEPIEGSTEETLVEKATTLEETTDDGTSEQEATTLTAESTTEEDTSSDSGSSAARSGGWSSQHQGNKHHGNSKWAHKGKSHPHHPSNH